MQHYQQNQMISGLKSVTSTHCLISNFLLQTIRGFQMYFCATQRDSLDLMWSFIYTRLLQQVIPLPRERPAGFRIQMLWMSISQYCGQRDSYSYRTLDTAVVNQSAFYKSTSSSLTDEFFQAFFLPFFLGFQLLYLASMLYSHYQCFFLANPSALSSSSANISHYFAVKGAGGFFRSIKSSMSIMCLEQTSNATLALFLSFYNYQLLRRRYSFMYSLRVA